MKLKRDKIYFSRVRPMGIIPSKKDEDGGYDLYADIKDDIAIPPSSCALVPTGIATAFHKDYVMLLRERGSTGTKNIKVNAGVIDSGFRGEIFVCIYNGNDKTLILTNSDGGWTDNKLIYYCTKKAIAQAVMVKTPRLKVQEVFYEQLKGFVSQRMFGKVGSSGK